MSDKEIEEVLQELQEVRPEKLTDKAKRLFEAIMKIADSRDKAESDLYEANNRINDLLDIINQKDKEIEELKIIADKYEDLKIFYEDNICELEKQSREIKKLKEKLEFLNKEKRKKYENRR